MNIRGVSDLIYTAEQALLELRKEVQEECNHPRRDSHYDSDGPHVFCLDCDREIG